jgi:hypothetical protein
LFEQPAAAAAMSISTPIVRMPEASHGVAGHARLSTPKRRKLAIAAAVTAVVLGVLITRAIWEGRDALHDGDAAAARGDLDGAIDGWRAAARWYVPLAPHVGDAYARLEGAAREAEDRRDGATALLAWRAIHSSILATRWLVTPHADLLARADRRIAALMASEPVSGAPAPDPDPDPTFRAAPDAGATPEARLAFSRAQLARDGAPSVTWVLVALAGFALWIGGCVHFARRGLDAQERLIQRVAAASGGMVAVGMLVWVLGLYNA